MKTIESFTKSKTGNDDLNEDCIVITDNFIAVIDGATSKTCPPIEGVSSGRFAAQLVAEGLRQLGGGVSAQKAVQAITAHLQSRLSDKIDLSAGVETPSASFVVYMQAHQEIWRVGDCPYVVDGVADMGGKIVDDITSSARSLALNMALRSGITAQEVMQDDIGRAFILPLLKEQHVLANDTGLYG